MNANKPQPQQQKSQIQPQKPQPQPQSSLVIAREHVEPLQPWPTPKK
jgi:hypothetical protein